MASINTGIEWTDKTWNPTTGCNKVSPGCTHCYAEAITKRFPKNFPNGFALTQHPERLQEPLRWRKPSRIFVNSMSDLFHEEVEISFLHEVFHIIRQTPQHIYQILTKRHERLLELAPQLDWPDNVWMGVSVESQNYVHRVDYLRQVPAKVRFLSCEPLAILLSLFLACGIITFAHAQKYLATIVALTCEFSVDSLKKELLLIVSGNISPCSSSKPCHSVTELYTYNYTHCPLFVT